MYRMQLCCLSWGRRWENTKRSACWMCFYSIFASYIGWAEALLLTFFRGPGLREIIFIVCVFSCLNRPCFLKEDLQKVREWARCLSPFMMFKKNLKNLLFFLLHWNSVSPYSAVPGKVCVLLENKLFEMLEIPTQIKHRQKGSCCCSNACYC